MGGGQEYGGSGSYDSQFQGYLYENYTPDDFNNSGDANGINIFSGAVKIVSTQQAFASLKSDGSILIWGHPQYGGT